MIVKASVKMDMNMSYVDNVNQRHLKQEERSGIVRFLGMMAQRACQQEGWDGYWGDIDGMHVSFEDEDHLRNTVVVKGVINCVRLDYPA